MDKKKSNFKENLFTALLVLTFVIPVIPFGLYLVYDNLFVNHRAVPNKIIDYSDAETINNTDEVIETAPVSTFGDYECTSDCSGHEAGYNWAEENDVCDEYFDGGNSESFAEGVRAYTEDNCY